MSALNRYFEECARVARVVEETQGTAMEKAAKAIADATEKKKNIFVSFFKVVAFLAIILSES